LEIIIGADTGIGSEFSPIFWMFCDEVFDEDELLCVHPENTINRKKTNKIATLELNSISCLNTLVELNLSNYILEKIHALFLQMMIPVE
jgi:hypothetical protein